MSPTPASGSVRSTRWEEKLSIGSQRLISTLQQRNRGCLTPLTFGLPICKMGARTYARLPWSYSKSRKKALKITLAHCKIAQKTAQSGTSTQDQDVWEDGWVADSAYSAKVRTWVRIPGIHMKCQSWLDIIITSAVVTGTSGSRELWPVRLVRNNSISCSVSNPVSFNKTESDRKTPTSCCSLLGHTREWVCIHTCAHHTCAMCTGIISLVKIKHSAYLAASMHEGLHSISKIEKIK